MPSFRKKKKIVILCFWIDIPLATHRNKFFCRYSYVKFSEFCTFKPATKKLLHKLSEMVSLLPVPKKGHLRCFVCI